MKSIFLSYANEDRVFAEKLATALREQGIDVWRDVENIRPGDNWASSIEQALNTSSAIVFISSSHSINSSWVTRELMQSSANGKLLIPLVIDESDKKLPSDFENIQWIDLQNGFELAVLTIVETLGNRFTSPEPIEPLEIISKGYVLDLSRFSAAPSSYLSGSSFKSQGAFPA